MKRFVSLLAVCVLVLAVSIASAGRSGKSDTYQLEFDDVIGMAHVTAPELDGPVHIVANFKGLDPGTEYVVKSQRQIVGQGYPNPAGNLNLEGTIEDIQGYGYVNLRLATDNSLVDSTTEQYDVAAP
ncbi:MAG TPA: hypothetical protein PLU87_18810 [Sedimentisphaerales bacterium]|nr:hypothetical protein [Sedimentisphaerales bacterium]HRS13136.1 hypothetical protein [Sedimentisphaerales bacterium]